MLIFFDSHQLKERVIESVYEEKHHKSLREHTVDVKLQIERLQNAENNYYLTAKYLNTRHTASLEKSKKSNHLLIKPNSNKENKMNRLLFLTLIAAAASLSYDQKTKTPAES